MLLGCALGEPEPGSDVVSQEIERGGNCRGHCRRLCRRKHRPGHQRRDCRKQCRIDCDASVATSGRQDGNDIRSLLTIFTYLQINTEIKRCVLPQSHYTSSLF